MPLPSMISVLVQDAMMQRLLSTDLKVLPSLPPEQIDQQIALARAIADHPVEVLHIVQEQLDMLDASIKETVGQSRDSWPQGRQGRCRPFSRRRQIGWR